MLHWLRRHPFAVEAHFDFSLVLTYACPADSLRPLLPPGLVLDTYNGWGFLAIALVRTRSLRPAGIPRWLGRDFFLSGYRIFSRYETVAGRRLRGLRILRSDTDRAIMVRMGNLFTHYAYRPAQVRWRKSATELSVQIDTPAAEANLDVTVDLASENPGLPVGSPFPDERTARLYAGPLPFTFDYEPETHSIIRIEGVRQEWHPRMVRATVRQATFLERSPFAEARPQLASAFMVEGIDYRWKRGVRQRL